MLKRLSQKTIAISSGKGGVGKTTTSINLALYYAKKDLRVGLIDLDPLSNIATMLDINEAEAIVYGDETSRKKETLHSHILKVFRNFDIIFPLAKLKQGQSKEMLESLYNRFINDLNSSYDVIIYDLPAGIRYDDNLAFLRYTTNLVLVTNAEPAAHVSAGGYIKSVLEIEPKLQIHLWHNKYMYTPDSDFNPVDVVGNYNKNVSAELKLGKIVTRNINNIAFIPHDAALDLLQTNPSAAINIQRCLLDLACFMQEQRINDLKRELHISEKLFHLIRYFIIHSKKISNVDKFMGELGEYLKKVLITNFISHLPEGRNPAGNIKKMSIFNRSEQGELKHFLLTIQNDKLMQTLTTLIEYLERALRAAEESANPFTFTTEINMHRALDKQIGLLLISINEAKADFSDQLVNQAGVYTFYFSLYKLLQSKTVLKVINDFIPKKKNKKGLRIRNRREQIRNLVEKNEAYRSGYFTLIKTLYPVIIRQISTVISTLNLGNLMLRDKDNRINKVAYLKLFSNFIHETINSGLSVIIGFHRRPAVTAFKKAADLLLEKININ